jgi:hypothetical protein
MMMGFHRKVYNHSAGQKFFALIEPKSSLPCSQNPAILPYPEPVQSSPQFDTLFLTIFPLLSQLGPGHLSP